MTLLHPTPFPGSLPCHALCTWSPSVPNALVIRTYAFSESSEEDIAIEAVCKHQSETKVEGRDLLGGDY